MRRRLVVLVSAAAALAFVAVGGASAAATGEQRVLVVLATWGPEPFASERVREVVFQETDAFMRAGSFGSMWLTGDVTPWLRVFPSQPDCDAPAIARAGRAGATRAGFDPSRFDRVIYLFPRNSCPFAGLASGSEALLNGALSRTLVAHELGHTYGLGHANSWECRGGSCNSREYGNPYDTMGSGSGHFNAWGKFELGWITNVARPERAGTFVIGALDQPSTAPQALVIKTARSEYWLDHRLEQLPIRAGVSTLPTGVFVHVGPNRAAAPTMLVYPEENLLLPDPAGRGRAPLFPGESFVDPGVFEVSFVRQDAAAVELRFEWRDTTPPAPLRIVDPGRRVRPGGTLLVSWNEPQEHGSGVAHYEIALDGARPIRIDATFGTTIARLRKPRLGAHTLAIVAVDRAGNRSRPTVRGFRVVKRMK